VTNADFELAKEADLLEPLDPDVIPLDLLEPGTYDEFGYQVYTSGVVVGWLPETYPEGTPHPENFEDLFDTERFPGKRCMYQGPQFGGVFEGAQLAAGVAPSDLYPIDFDVAFGELDKIKDDIVWWKSGAEAAQFLLNGTCELGVIWNGIAQSTANAGNDIDVTWGNAITVYGMNTIPKGSPNPEAAQELLATIIEDETAQLEFLEQTAYTVPLKQPPALPESVAKWAPQGDNLATAIPEDSEYYAANNADITKRFNNWLVTGQ
jgi:putative spermidine/putrescine transport system substrate-binding protein